MLLWSYLVRIIRAIDQMPSSQLSSTLKSATAKLRIHENYTDTTAVHATSGNRSIPRLPPSPNSDPPHGVGEGLLGIRAASVSAHLNEWRP
jgi:hypothetical protein